MPKFGEVDTTRKALGEVGETAGDSAANDEMTMENQNSLEPGEPL